MSSVYETWYRSTSFTPEEQEAITDARRRFHAVTDQATKRLVSRLAVSTIIGFTASNSMVERWPKHIRVLMNRSSSGSRIAVPPPFETWARPRDLEKRKQAVSVWSSLLAFLAFNWNEYGADGALETMGLRLPWARKDQIDTIREYALSGGSREVLGAMIKSFFTEIIKDADPTAGTNPLLWWVGVLVQTEVLDDQPRWTVADLEDTLDMAAKLEAIDHYARVLILDDGYYAWMGNVAPNGPSEQSKDKVQTSLNEVSIDWVDADAERPIIGSVEETLHVTSSAWSGFIAYITPVFNKWLTDNGSGPMATIIKLQGKSDSMSRRQEYVVRAEIHENYSVDPMVADTYPVEVDTLPTIQEANLAARAFIEEELGSKNKALKWDEVYEPGGVIRIRAVYRNDVDDAKAIAWVEEAS